MVSVTSRRGHPRRKPGFHTVGDDVRSLMDDYPRIYFACHLRHLEDANHRVSARQLAILDHLDEFESVSLTELAYHMGVTVSTMSIAADRLERMGYLGRYPDDRDRRRLQLRLTTEGARAKAKASVLDPELVRDMLKRMTPKDRHAALLGLNLLANAASRAMDERHAHARSWQGKFEADQKAGRL